MSEEIWKDIQGYEGLYQVSSMGNVRSLDRVAWHPQGDMRLRGKLLNKLKRKGYVFVGLYLRGQWKAHSIHRLVATAFIPNYENKPHVNHINFIRNCNYVENLEWCTQKENHQHSVRNGRAGGNARGSLHPSARKIAKVDLVTGNVLKIYETTCSVKDDGFRQSGVVNCALGKYRFSGGFKWRYVDA